MLYKILNPFIITLSLATAAGVLLHDTRIDKMATTALSGPVVAPSYEGNVKMNFSTDPHTHTERHSLSQVVHDLKTPNPRLQPRTNEDKKHLLQKHAARGYYNFDNYNLPFDS